MENTKLTETEENAVHLIAERWKGNKRRFCGECMYQSIRHGDRNLDRACDSNQSETNSEDSEEHPDRYDGEIIAYAPEDIWTLLHMMERLGLCSLPLSQKDLSKSM